MKRKIALLVLAGFLITGCGNKVKCTYKDGDNKNTVTGIFNKKVLSKIETKQEIQFKDTTVYEQYCNMVKSQAKDADLKVTCSKRKVTVEGTSKVDKKDNISKNKFKKTYKKQGYTCK